jgi:hypothetical protein
MAVCDVFEYQLMASSIYILPCIFGFDEPKSNRNNVAEELERLSYWETEAIAQCPPLLSYI